MPEAPFDVFEDGFIQDEFPVEQFRDGFTGQIVFGGPKSAARKNQRHAFERIAEHFRQQFAVVAHNRLANDLDAELVEFLGEKQRVGIHVVRSQ